MVHTATDLLKRFWDGSLPVNPLKIALAMGLQVIPHGDLQDGASGMIEVLPNGHVVIRYVNREVRVRQRFTIAHEIGHFALGHLQHGQTMFRDTQHNFLSYNSDPREVAANRFAAELLMPDFAVRHAIEQGMVENITDLSMMFDVSEAAMGYRLKNLGF